MAGIIARITRSNRERLNRKKTEINVGKCNYELDPFDPCFDPRVMYFLMIQNSSHNFISFTLTIVIEVLAICSVPLSITKGCTVVNIKY